MQDAFARWAEALGATRPLVLAIDDLHWADRTTRDLAERLLTLTDRSAVMLAAALRPDPGSEGWSFRLEAQTRFAHRVEELSLAPLEAEAARALIDELVPAGLVGEPVKDEVVTKAEGNPLYLEELLRALLETGGDRRRTWTITPKTAAELPPALEALLVARIDRLEPGARRLAQVASVVGREFPVSVAAEVADSAEDDIAALLRAEIVREVRRFPELECTFRHGLLQEAALSTLTPTSQRELYGRVGHAMEAHLGDQANERLEQLAFYFYRSDETEKGLAYLERAAEHAVTVEALGRAEELWERARRLPSAPATSNGSSGSITSSRGYASVRRGSCRSSGETRASREAATRPWRGRLAGADSERDQVRVRRRGRRALVRVLGQRLQDRPRQPLRRVGAVRAGVGGLDVQVRAREVEHRRVRERRAARGAFVGEASQRVDVRGAGRLGAAEQLGREVVERPHHHPGLGEHRVRAALREPEVREIGRTRLVDDHVRRLHVAVHDAARMQRVQPRRDVGDDADHVLEGHRPVARQARPRATGRGRTPPRGTGALRPRRRR